MGLLISIVVMLEASTLQFALKIPKFLASGRNAEKQQEKEEISQRFVAIFLRVTPRKRSL